MGETLFELSIRLKDTLIEVIASLAGYGVDVENVSYLGLKKAALHAIN